MNLLILLFQLQNSPGAKAAGVASFISIKIIIQLLYAACIHLSLKEMESKAIQDYNENFLNLSPDQNKS
jgi:hypothetical protein